MNVVPFLRQQSEANLGGERRDDRERERERERDGGREIDNECVCIRASGYGVRKTRGEKVADEVLCE